MYFVKPAVAIAGLSVLLWTLGSSTTAYAGHGHRSHGSHGSSGGSHGSSGGSFGSHGSSGGSYGSSGGSSGGDTTPAPAPEKSAMRYYRPQGSAARLVVNVPSDAKVYLQDQLMTISGPVRRYVSPRLTPGTEYVYQIRVEVERDGRTLSKTTTAKVRSGQNVDVKVALDSNNPSELVARIER